MTRQQEGDEAAVKAVYPDARTEPGWLDDTLYAVRWAQAALNKIHAMSTEQQREFVENYKPSVERKARR